jgi:hypothetical protein
VGGIDDRINPETGGGVARIGLMLVGGADRFVQFFFVGVAEFLAGALELLDFYFNERAGG